MKITPLVIHGGLRIPVWTPLFSDALAVTAIAVTAGGNVVIQTATPHKVPIGRSVALCVTDSDVPNPITAATVNGDGNIVLTTQYPHDLTTTPDPELYPARDSLVRLSGFTDSDINGNRELIDLPDRNTLVVQPGGVIASITLTGSERLTERLDGEVIGWHAVTAASTTTLRFPTPPNITRDYLAVNPVVVWNIRIYGALDHDTAQRQFTDSDANYDAGKAHMFLLPHRVTSRRSSSALSGANADLSPGVDARMMLLDGFTVLVFIPSGNSAAHVAAIDAAQGDVFKAVLRTYHGLRLRRSELADAGLFESVLNSHQGATLTKPPLYMHEYVFDAPATLTDCDTISATDWSEIDDAALGANAPQSIYPVGSGSFHDLDVTGILHTGHPSPLTGTFEMENV